MLSSIKAKLIGSFLFVVVVMLLFGGFVMFETGLVKDQTTVFIEDDWSTADLIMETRISYEEIANSAMEVPASLDREKFIAESSAILNDFKGQFAASSLPPAEAETIASELRDVVNALPAPVRLFGHPGETMEAADAAVGPLLDLLEQRGDTAMTNKVWEMVMAFNDILITNDPVEKNRFDRIANEIENAPNFASIRATYNPFKEKALEVFAAAVEFIEARQLLTDAGAKLAHQLDESEGTFEREVVDPAAAEVLSSLTLTQILLAVGLLIAALLAMIIGYITAVRISTPLRQAAEMLKSMKKGHINRRIDLERNDELGDMADSINSFADSLEMEVITPLQQLSQGDLTFEAHPRDERDLLRNALRQLCEDLNVTMKTIQEAGDQINSGACQVADSSTTLSQGATESAASLEEISASMNEISSQTSTSAGNANQANLLSAEARNAAEEGSKRMEEMVVAMGEINEAGQNISKIIKVIDEIAFQTNLLALNAAVEAARAGQHGKGFAVVAEEVRNLAARSAKAAEETAELIEGSVEKATNGTQVAEKTADALTEVVSGITKVSDLVSEIAAASSEQAQGISQVNTGLSQIDQVIQQNTASAEESAATSEELASQAGQLNSMLKRFALAGSNTGGALIRWTGDLNTGIPDIDDQHRRLVDMINNLFSVMRQGSNQAEVERAIDDLVDYTRTHFTFEEELMRNHGYPGLVQHQQVHQRFVDQINEYAGRIKSDERLSAADVFSFLKDWLISHIAKQDRDGYAPMVRR